jgi:hypothetical protein
LAIGLGAGAQRLVVRQDTNLATTSGRVGIGTSAPAEILHIHGTAGDGLQIDGMTYPGVRLISSAGGNSIMMMNHASYGILFKNEANATYPFNININGHVGIGTYTPNGKLTLVNNVSAGGPAANYASYQVLLYDAGTANASYGIGIESGNIWLNTNGGVKFYHAGTNVANIAANGAYAQVSDGRLKTDVKELNGALEKILSLRGVSYAWKDPQRGHNKEIGLIGQEVAKVYPEFVYKDDAGHITVNYAGLVAPLIESVKAQQQEIADLKVARAQLESQAKEIAELKALVRQLASR